MLQERSEKENRTMNALVGLIALALVASVVMGSGSLTGEDARLTDGADAGDQDVEDGGVTTEDSVETETDVDPAISGEGEWTMYNLSITDCASLINDLLDLDETEEESDEEAEDSDTEEPANEDTPRTVDSEDDSDQDESGATDSEDDESVISLNQDELEMLIDCLLVIIDDELGDYEYGYDCYDDCAYGFDDWYDYDWYEDEDYYFGVECDDYWFDDELDWFDDELDWEDYDENESLEANFTMISEAYDDANGTFSLVFEIDGLEFTEVGDFETGNVTISWIDENGTSQSEEYNMYDTVLAEEEYYDENFDFDSDFDCEGFDHYDFEDYWYEDSEWSDYGEVCSFEVEDYYGSEDDYYFEDGYSFEDYYSCQTVDDWYDYDSDVDWHDYDDESDESEEDEIGSE